MKPLKREFSTLDNILSTLNVGFKTLLGTPVAQRATPTAHPLTRLTVEEQKKASRLMRVNHAGEVAAQALYQGQALTARSTPIQHQLQKAAMEEVDHLAWCQQRIIQLNSHTSWLNPLWYTGALAIGATAGLLGDVVNLGFLAETEKQVEAHLSKHLNQLPPNDLESRAILEAMREDEIQHAQTALDAGGVPLPLPIRFLMKAASKVMTTASLYW